MEAESAGGGACHARTWVSGSIAPEAAGEDGLEHLKAAYGATVEEVTVSEEHVRFPLPKELRVLESQDNR